MRFFLQNALFAPHPWTEFFNRYVYWKRPTSMQPAYGGGLFGWGSRCALCPQPRPLLASMGLASDDVFILARDILGSNHIKCGKVLTVFTWPHTNVSGQMFWVRGGWFGVCTRKKISKVKIRTAPCATQHAQHFLLSQFFQLFEFFTTVSWCRRFTPYCDANTIRSVRSVSPSLRLVSIAYSFISPMCFVLFYCALTLRPLSVFLCMRSCACSRLFPNWRIFESECRPNLNSVFFIFKACVILLQFLLKFFGVFAQQIFLNFMIWISFITCHRIGQVLPR